MELPTLEYRKKSFLKITNRKHGNLGNIIPSFLISEFSIFPQSQNRKLGFKNLGKIFPTFKRFPRSLSFRPGQRLSAEIDYNKKDTKSIEKDKAELEKQDLK